MSQVRERWSIYGPNDVLGSDNNHGRSTGRSKRVMLSARYQRIAIVLAVLDALWRAIHWPLRSDLVARLVTQLNNPLILLLAASAIISLLLGQLENCLSITIVSAVWPR